MKISAIIPHYPRLPEYNDMLRDTINCLDADEYIIAISEGSGLGRALNLAFKAATGDYFVVCSNDCRMIEGSLKDLCIEDGLGIPKDVPGQYDQPRSFFCVPRWVIDKVGYYDEQFVPAYFEDDDMINRWREADIHFNIVDSVKVAHQPGTTMDALPDRNDIFERNKELYLKKWGKDAKYGPTNV